MTVTETPPTRKGPVSVPRERRQLRSPLGGAGAWYVYTAAFGAAIVIPIAVFFWRAFADGAAGIGRLWSTPDIGHTMLTTILLAAGGTGFGSVIAVIMSVLLSRVPRRIRPIASVVPLLPLVIPPVAFVYGWIFVFDTRVGYANILLRNIPFWNGDSGPVNIYSVEGILLVTSIEVSAVIFAFVDARMKEINGSVEAAARIAGASQLRSFWTITLPLLRPSLVAGVVVAFLIQLGQFTAPLFLGSRANIEVITTEIFRLREQFPVDYALSAALGLPLLVFGIIAITVQRRAIGDQRKYVTMGSGRGVEAKNSRFAAVLVFGYGLIFVGLPVVAAALVSLSPFWDGRLDNLKLSFSNFRDAFADPGLTDAIFNGLKASITASLVVMVLGFVGSLALSGVVQAPKVVTRVLDYIFIAPLAVPRALLGMVVLFVFIRPPFYLYGTLTIYIIGYVFVALPFSMRSQFASLIGVPSSHFEAARICGAGQLRTVIGIAVPTAFRGMIASFTMAFIFLSNDVAVSLMIQAPGKEVVGTKLYSLQQAGTVPEIAVLALIMTAITVAVLAFTFALAGRRALENL